MGKRASVKVSREAIYDAQIAPLMAQIIDICKQHDIPILASFQLTPGDDPLLCTTVIVPDWADFAFQRTAARLRAMAAE